MHASGKVTIITPTTGKPSLDALIESIERQTLAKAAFHLLLWDDVRDAAAHAPERYDGENRMSLVLPRDWARMATRQDRHCARWP
jgi:hypothetical protein